MFLLNSAIHFVGSLQHFPKQIGLCLLKTSDEVVGVMLVMRLDDYIICIFDPVVDTPGMLTPWGAK